MNLELWKKIKKEKKLTIEQIAQKANLPKGSVQNIFCGYVPNPRSDTVEAIEKALGINRIIEEDDLKIGLNQEPREKLKQIPVAMYDGLDGLTDEQVQDVLKYIEFIKSKDKEGK